MGGYVTPTDLEARLQSEYEDSGQERAHRVQAQKYEQARMAWRESRKQKRSADLRKQVLDTPQKPIGYTTKTVLILTHNSKRLT
jgi:hypothetical protein